MTKIDFSYASKSEHNFAQRLIIKTIETLTGKKKLEKLYKNYSIDSHNPKTFWSDILDQMEIKIVSRQIRRSACPCFGSIFNGDS